jgi:hypothetical protein
VISFGGVTYGEMADSITPANLNNLPFVPDAFLGYVDGRWPDYAQIAAQHGNKPCYGLDVFGNPTGDGTDSEPGNASISQTVACTKADLARGVDRPIVYCPASWATAMVNAHAGAGIARSSYRLVTAHYGGPTAPGAPVQGMHICGPFCGYGPGADATQWQSLNAYDRSILAPNFITAQSHPGTPSGVKPLPALDGPIVCIVNRPQNDGYWLIGQDGGVFAFGAAPSLGDPAVGKLTPGRYARHAVSTPSGEGLIIAASDGGVFCLGDAKFHGSLGAAVSPSTVPLEA